MKTTKEILYEAARIVEKGWCKGDLYRGDKVCVIGAVCRAEGNSSHRARKRAYAALHRVIGTEFLYNWNDAPERTQGEVVLALGFAAEMAGEDNA